MNIGKHVVECLLHLNKLIYTLSPVNIHFFSPCEKTLFLAKDCVHYTTTASRSHAVYYCGTMNDNGPCSDMYLNSWSPLCGAVWK